MDRSPNRFIRLSTKWKPISNFSTRDSMKMAENPFVLLSLHPNKSSLDSASNAWEKLSPIVFLFFRER